MCAATLAPPPGRLFRQLLSAAHTPGDLMNALPHLEHDPGISSLLAMERSGAGARVLCWAGWGQLPWLAASASHGGSLLRERWGGRSPGRALQGSTGQCQTRP